MLVTHARPFARPFARRAARARQLGFTLAELLVAVAIVGLLAGIGVPMFRQGLDFVAAKGAAIELASDLRYARAEALKRNTTVTVTPISGSWSQGWEVRTAANELLSQHVTTRSGVTISAPSAGVTFASSGRLADTDADPTSLKWLVDTSTESGKRCVTLGVTGAAHIDLGACA